MSDEKPHLPDDVLEEIKKKGQEEGTKDISDIASKLEGKIPMRKDDEEE